MRDVSWSRIIVGFSFRIFRLRSCNRARRLRFIFHCSIVIVDAVRFELSSSWVSCISRLSSCSLDSASDPPGREEVELISSELSSGVLNSVICEELKVSSSCSLIRFKPVGYVSGLTRGTFLATLIAGLTTNFFFRGTRRFGEATGLNDWSISSVWRPDRDLT